MLLVQVPIRLPIAVLRVAQLLLPGLPDVTHRALNSILFALNGGNSFLWTLQFDWAGH